MKRGHSKRSILNILQQSFFFFKLTDFIFLFKLYFYLIERQSDTERKRSTVFCNSQSGASRSQELRTALEFPWRWQGLKYTHQLSSAFPGALAWNWAQSQPSSTGVALTHMWRCHCHFTLASFLQFCSICFSLTWEFQNVLSDCKQRGSPRRVTWNRWHTSLKCTQLF